MQSEAVNQWLDAAHVRSLAEGLLVPGPRGTGFPNEKMFGASFVGFADPAEEQAPATTDVRQSLSDAQSRAASSGMIRGAEPAPESVQKPVQIVAQPTRAVPSPEPENVAEPISAVSESELSQQNSVDSLTVEPAPIQPDPVEQVEPVVVQTTQVRPEELEVTAPVVPEPAAQVEAAAIESPFKIASKPDSPAPQPVQENFRPLPLSTRLQAFGTWLKEQIPTRAYFICDRHGEIVVDEVGSEKLIKVARTLAHASNSAGRQVGEDQNLGSLHVKIGSDRVMEVIPRHSHFGLVVLGIIVQRPLSRDAVASVSRALGTALAEPSPPRE